VAVPLLETHDGLVQVRFPLELEGLVGERTHEVLREYFRKPADVEDVFLGIQRRELTAERGQRIDDPGFDAAHAGIEKCKQAGGSAADDRDVDLFVSGLSHGEY
jgi:hypothetical protein